MIDAQRLIGCFPADRTSAMLERQQLGIILQGESILGLELGLARFLTTDRILCIPLSGPFGTPRELGRVQACRVDARRERRKRGTGHVVILAGLIRAGATLRAATDAHAAATPIAVPAPSGDQLAVLENAPFMGDSRNVVNRKVRFAVTDERLQVAALQGFAWSMPRSCRQSCPATPMRPRS
jgi:hypothetical protein